MKPKNAMNIAIFSDVHGNLPALEAFLAAVKNRVDGYLCLGDIVNYGPWNDECLELITVLPVVQIVEGNHERLFLDREDIAHETPLVQAFTRASRQSFTRYDLIENLPKILVLGSFTAIHTINGKSIYPDTLIDVDKNYLIGHSHHQFELNPGIHRIINPGSIGQNRCFINIVSFAILDTETEEVWFEEIEYDVDAAIGEMVRLDYPDDCIGYYRNKNRLDCKRS